MQLPSFQFKTFPWPTLARRGATLGLTLTSAICAVQGFTEVFAHSTLLINTCVVGAIAVCLELGKIAITGTLSVSYRKMSRPQRTFLILALMILMASNAVYSYGFFLNAYQASTVPNTLFGMTQANAQTQLDRASRDLQVVQDEINAVPGSMPTGKTRLQLALAPRIEADQNQINTAQKMLLGAETGSLQAQVQAGPLLATARLFNLTPNQLAHGLILATVLVFDPLAVTLLSIEALLQTKPVSRPRRSKKTKKTAARRRPMRRRRLSKKGLGQARATMKNLLSLSTN